MWLTIDGAKTKFNDLFIGPPSFQKTINESISLIIILQGFRLAGGPDWMPMEVHLTGSKSDGLEEFLPPGKCVFRYNQPSSGLVFPTKTLSYRMQSNIETPLCEHPFSNPGNSPSIRMERILDSLELNTIPNLDVFSTYFDMSPRSLQRQFEEEGTTFKKIVEQWRFKTALSMVENPKMSIKEIGDRLGYTHSPNFIRAFKGWAGTTPQKYREEIGQLNKVFG
jgi:AraC-like DNA-binding protein